MKDVAIRVESSIPRRLKELQQTKRDTSEITRRIVRLGVEAKEEGGYAVECPLGNILLEDIPLGGEEGRLHFYVEDELLQRAHKAFNADDQTVIKKSLRLGLWVLQKYSEQEKIKLLNQNNINRFSTIERPEIYDILRFLEPSNTTPILIVTGTYGAGKSHLIHQALSLLETPIKATNLTDTNIKQQIEKLSQLYKIVKVDASSRLEPQEQAIEQLLGISPEKRATFSPILLRSLLSEIAAKKPLLFYLEILEPSDLESLDLLASTPNIKTIIEASIDVADKISKSNISHQLTTITIDHKPPKIIEIKL